MDKYLNVHGILYKHFGSFVQHISNQIKEHAAEYAAAHAGTFGNVYDANAQTQLDEIRKLID